MAEYILLLAISLAVFLALFTAFSVAATTAQNDATAIAAENIASHVSGAIVDTAGDGTASSRVSLDLPEDICTQPYVVYPAPDSRRLVVIVNGAGQPQKYAVPLLLRAEGVRVAGFMVSGPGKRSIAYNAVSRVVTIS